MQLLEIGNKLPSPHNTGLMVTAPVLYSTLIAVPSALIFPFWTEAMSGHKYPLK
jgi:hypothetical protein